MKRKMAMKFRKISYYIEKILIAIVTCFGASLLFNLIIIPLGNAENHLIIHFLDGLLGIFLYLLPLFIIWFFPISFFIDGLNLKYKLSRLNIIKFQLYSGIILALAFNFIFDNHFNLLLLIIYFFISFLSSVIFYFLNSIGNRMLN